MGLYCANVRCGLRRGEFVVSNEHVKRLADRVVDLLAELGKSRRREMDAERRLREHTEEGKHGERA
jgi:hypothetical protein